MAMSWTERNRNRKTISINGKVFARLQARCDADGIAMSQRVETLLADLEGGPLPAPKVAPTPPPRSSRKFRPTRPDARVFAVSVAAPVRDRIWELANDSRRSMRGVADVAINRMLDHIEQNGLAS